MARVGLGSWMGVLVGVLAGCGSGPIGDDDGESGETTVQTSTEAGESSDTTGDGDGDPTGDGDGDPTTGDGDGDPTTGDGDGDPLCPAPEDVSASFTVEPGLPLAATCMVLGEDGDGMDLYEMTLQCDNVLVTVSLDSSIQHKPSPGAMVAYDYRVDLVGLSFDRWLAIHQLPDEQALVLGTVSASKLDPPGTTLAEFFGDPAVSVAADQPCETTSDDCGELRRLALEVSIEQFVETALVFDSSSWFVDFLAFGYEMIVDEATQRVPPVRCDDVPDEWFELQLVWFPSD